MHSRMRAGRSELGKTRRNDPILSPAEIVSPMHMAHLYIAPRRVRSGRRRGHTIDRCGAVEPRGKPLSDPGAIGA